MAKSRIAKNQTNQKLAKKEPEVFSFSIKDTSFFKHYIFVQGEFSALKKKYGVVKKHENGNFYRHRALPRYLAEKTAELIKSTNINEFPNGPNDVKLTLPTPNSRRMRFK